MCYFIQQYNVVSVSYDEFRNIGTGSLREPLGISTITWGKGFVEFALYFSRAIIVFLRVQYTICAVESKQYCRNTFVGIKLRPE